VRESTTIDVVGKSVIDSRCRDQFVESRKGGLKQREVICFVRAIQKIRKACAFVEVGIGDAFWEEMCKY